MFVGAIRRGRLHAILMKEIWQRMLFWWLWGENSRCCVLAGARLSLRGLVRQLLSSRGIGRSMTLGMPALRVRKDRVDWLKKCSVLPMGYELKP